MRHTKRVLLFDHLPLLYEGIILLPALLVCKGSWLRLDRCWPGTVATASVRHVAAAPNWRMEDTREAV